MAFSITSLCIFFEGETKSISRGENHYKSGHVESITYIPGVLKGKVRASMKDKVYNVTVYVDESYLIKSTQCECPRGEFKCSHAAALFIHAINSISVTDVECSWKRQKTESLSTHAVSELYQPRRPGYVPLTREPNDEDKAALYADLCNYGRFTGLWWLLSPEPQKQEKAQVKLIKEVVFSSETLEIPSFVERLDFIKSKILVTSQEIFKASQLTIGQRENPQWHLVRKGRLTASRFGLVLNAKRITPSLIKQILGEYDLSGVKSIAWGLTNEAEAIGAFSKRTKLEVVSTGIWLDSSGVLGASPDGLVGLDHVLEVKCPYTQKDQSLEEALKSKTFCLQKEGSLYLLKKDHAYWHQVQGQMYLTNRNNCYFVVWTLTWSVITEIKKDPSWEENIDKLKNFYFGNILPKIMNDELF
ncbi:uncharacterized protein LOC135688717 [Rhopilema esculentum]|uniref:uncharacterized protein LOC135688717 n=1 Tax=Rhopilema esculentum TaxID=499914 RepID=UPI0031D905D4|eukprot:gene7660-13484_t